MKLIPNSAGFSETNSASSQPKDTFGKSKLGSGGRFAACEASGKSKELCAYIGRRAYGGSAMAKMAAKGRKG